MKTRENKPRFERETDLCAAFIAAAASEQPRWKMYPETEGWDILAVREDGVQVGIEAKLRLNSLVVAQALPNWFDFGVIGPEFRAVLVPSGQVEGNLLAICRALGIAVIKIVHPDSDSWGGRHYSERLPDLDNHMEWHEWAPAQRHKLPDWIPDVAAGSSSPMQLKGWKIGAIKLAILMETRPITRADFKAAGINPARWTLVAMRWLIKTPEGYIPGSRIPDFKAQHPINYEQIKADRAKWDWTKAEAA